MPRVFHHRHRVTYAECTIGNHVYYARYLEMLEAARGELFRSLEIPLSDLQEAGVVFPAVEVKMRFRAPARYDDVLDITLWLTLLRGARMAFEYRLERDRQPILEGVTDHFCASLDEKPRRIPATVLERLQPFLHDRRPVSESA